MNNISEYLIKSAELFPDKTAVCLGKEELNYRELDTISSRLANFLIRSRLKPGDRVGIYLSKSITAVVSIYGTMKARGVYVPIDPVAPISRVEYIMKQCDIKVLITKSDRLVHLAPLLSGGNIQPAFILLVDEPDQYSKSIIPVVSWEKINGIPHTLSPSLLNSYRQDDTAYILYTSGSTGRPKGVTLTHMNGMCYVDWAAVEMGFHRDDVFSSHAPFQFDLSILDLYAPVKVGGTLVLIPDKIKAVSSLLINYILLKKITVWYSVPLALIKMIKTDNAEMLGESNLRIVIFAGEIFHVKYLKQLYNLLPSADYYNLYGPTESNVCTYYKVKKSDMTDDALEALPIGKACDYDLVFAIDKDGKFIDLSGGGEGELCIAGKSVMSGYWNDDEKTKQAFVPVPPNLNVGGYAYLSGDLVRIDRNGNYVYVGRKDRMVKCKGYRIELNEIEVVMGKNEFVKEVAVVLTEESEFESQIIAFVSLHLPGVIDEPALKQFCRQILPHYMVPGKIVILENLPLTITDKINYPELKKRAKGICLHEVPV